MVGCYLFGLVIWLLSAFAVALRTWWVAVGNTRRSRGRWGFREKVHEAAGEGPYREGETREPIARRAPLSVWLMAILGPAWAALTLSVFSPLGALATLGCAVCPTGWVYPSSIPCQIGSGWHVAASLVEASIVLSGIVLAIALLRAVVVLPKSAPDDVKVNHATARYGLVHHLIALGWCVVSLAPGEELAWVAAFNLPSVFGLGVAGLHWRAVTHVRAAAAETDVERADGPPVSPPRDETS